MLRDERDAAYLWDMLETAQIVQRLVAGMTFERYCADRDKQLATERALEIIGEAARRVSEPFKQAHSDIPWSAIIGQRNVLAHDYVKIRQDRVWATLTEHVPKLVAALRPLIPPLPPEVPE